VYRSFLKPIFDLCIALPLAAILLPLFIVIAIMILVFNSTRPFFMQSRTGKNGRVFTLIKFKTMNDRRDASGNLLPDAERLTPLGRFLRSTSLDELPQLINVIKGDMSLVGPRPLLPKYLPLYNERQARRHEVKPGITGWAQVNGRNALSWQEKFELDVWYVDHVSFLLDLKILWLTLIKVIKRQGIAADGAVSGLPFKGNENLK
jgi:lipopolysaccharide/colanic/teichoic acid biosynthesis glycosyltransferase